MLTIVQCRNDLISKLGYENVADVPATGLQDVVIAINGAMQILQSAGEDYFTRQFLTVPLIAGTSFYVLSGVQSVIGPIRWNNVKPLRALQSRGELDQFSRIFLGEEGYGSGEGEPIAYWPENVRNSLSAGDINQINLWIVPRPITVPGSVVVEVINDAPSYVVGDLTSSVVVPVAQNYTESIFLPIARMLVTRSYLFSRPDIMDQLTADYNQAMATLGFKGGFPNEIQDRPPREVNA